jgi:hypothetical protein
MSDELAITMPAEPSRSKQANEFLRHVLCSGALSAIEIENQARANHLLVNGVRVGTDKAFRLARQKIGISRNNGTIYRGNNGRWHWKLPAPDPAIAAERKIVDLVARVSRARKSDENEIVARLVALESECGVGNIDVGALRNCVRGILNREIQTAVIYIIRNSEQIEALTVVYIAGPFYSAVLKCVEQITYVLPDYREHGHVTALERFAKQTASRLNLPLFKRELAYRPVSKESQLALSRNPEADGSMSLEGVQ